MSQTPKITFLTKLAFMMKLYKALSSKLKVIFGMKCTVQIRGSYAVVMHCIMHDIPFDYNTINPQDLDIELSYPKQHKNDIYLDNLFKNINVLDKVYTTRQYNAKSKTFICVNECPIMNIDISRVPYITHRWRYYNMYIMDASEVLRDYNEHDCLSDFNKQSRRIVKIALLNDVIKKMNAKYAKETEKYPLYKIGCGTNMNSSLFSTSCHLSGDSSTDTFRKTLKRKLVFN